MWYRPSPLSSSSSRMLTERLQLAPAAASGPLVPAFLRAATFLRNLSVMEASWSSPALAAAAACRLLRSTPPIPSPPGGADPPPPPAGAGDGGVVGSGDGGVVGSGDDGDGMGVALPPPAGAGDGGVVGSGDGGVVGSGDDGVVGSGDDGVVGCGDDGGVVGSGDGGVVGSGDDGDGMGVALPPPAGGDALRGEYRATVARWVAPKTVHIGKTKGLSARK